MKYPNGDTPMTPFGNFLFFFWFDWINGAVIVMWSMLVCEDLLFECRTAKNGMVLQEKDGNGLEDSARRRSLYLGKWLYLGNGSFEISKEERRIDPLLDNKAVTFLEMQEGNRGEDLSEDQLKEHWSNLQGRSEELMFTEHASDESINKGPLEAEGEWLVAVLKKPNGSAHGKIKLQYKDGKLVSQFKKDDSSAYSAPILAASSADWKENDDRAHWLMFVAVPLWFWATPPLSRLDVLPIDNRLLLVERPSEKGKYWILMALFAVVMKTQLGMRFTGILRVLLSGVGCGMIHHAPLFFYGMRGYSSQRALVLTLCTEWPAIMTGLFVITRYCCGRAVSNQGVKEKQEKKGYSKRSAIALFAVVMAVACAGPTKFSVRAIIYEIMPYIPAHHYQKLGQLYLRATTCLLPQNWLSSLPCSVGPASDLWVAAAAQKSAAVMTAMISLEIANACGKCVGIGQRPSGVWPNPIETPPEYPSELLLAIANMPDWPSYAAQLGAPVAAQEGYASYSYWSFLGLNADTKKRRSRCIVTVRDPVARLVSTFLYAKAGREPWFREHGIDRDINRLLSEGGKDPDGEDRVDNAVAFMLERFGFAYAKESHEYLLLNVKLGCTVIKYEDLVQDFNGTISVWLDTWGISKDPKVRDRLLDVTHTHSPSAQTTANHHATGRLHSKIFKASVEKALLSNTTLATMVETQRGELGYSRFWGWR